jgi:hypothetical protein
MELARPEVDSRALSFLRATMFRTSTFIRGNDGSCLLHPQLARVAVAGCALPQPRLEENAAWLASLLRC